PQPRSVRVPPRKKQPSGSDGATPSPGRRKLPSPAAKATTSRSRRPALADAAGGGRTADLVIVESPAKAKTINKYLGPNFKVLASYGHVRDLPKRRRKGEVVAGVDIESGWVPTYVVGE